MVLHSASVLLALSRALSYPHRRLTVRRGLPVRLSSSRSCTGRVVGYAYVLPSRDALVPAETYELGSLYVTEKVAGTGVVQL